MLKVNKEMGNISTDENALLKLAFECHMIDPKVINVRKIVLAEWVRWKCRYGSLTMGSG